MNSPILLLALVCGAFLPIPALILRRLDLRRDLLFLIYYAQAFLYVQFGPWDYMRRTPSASGLRGDYEALSVLSVILFNGVLLASYLLARGRDQPNAPNRRMQVSSRTFTLFNAAVLAFAVAFWIIAVTDELVFRRIGNTIIPKQLSLPLPEFVVYRGYIESVWFLSSVIFAGLVVGGRRISFAGKALAVANLVSAYLYLVINTRLGLGLVLALIVGLWALLWRGTGTYLPRLATVGGAAALVLLYSTSTTERIRVGFGRSNTVTWRAFMPGLSLEEKRAAAKIPGLRHDRRAENAGRLSPEAGSEEEIGGPGASLGEVVSGTLLYRAAAETPLSLRLNGLDLMARMRPSLETDGYAWGRAWKDPVALVYLPFLDPGRARQMKLRFDIAAKSYLMRRYTDLDQADYFSCMLTDAYGNLGPTGIALAGIVLGVALGLSVRGLRGPANALVPVLALFVISHLFQFEQEFVSAVVLWVKKLPFLAGVLVVNPFRTGRDASPPTSPP